MPRGRTRHLILPGVALLACSGVWLGHTAEYVRVWGWRGLQAEILGSVHLYMLPLGVVCTLLLATAAAAVLRIRRHLEKRRAGAAAQLATAWRTGGRSAHELAAARTTSQLSRRALVVRLGAALAVLQVVLYVVQENLENLAAGKRLPGLSVVVGAHWAAPILQIGVALLLALFTGKIAHGLRRKQQAVERVERVVRALLIALACRCRSISPTRTPLRVQGVPLLGPSVWCRPPPLTTR